MPMVDFAFIEKHFNQPQMFCKLLELTRQMHQQHVDLRKPSELVSAHSKKMMLSSGKPVSKMNPSIISTEIKKHLNN